MAVYRLRPYEVDQNKRVRYVIERRVLMFFWKKMRDNSYANRILYFDSVESAEELIKHLQVKKTYNVIEESK